MYQAAQNRYQVIPYRRCGASGLMLPVVSLGLWHNFGDTAPYENMRALCRTAFDTASPTLTLPTTTAPSRALPSGILVKFCGTTSASTATN